MTNRSTIDNVPKRTCSDFDCIDLGKLCKFACGEWKRKEEIHVCISVSLFPSLCVCISCTVIVRLKESNWNWLSYNVGCVTFYRFVNKCALCPEQANRETNNRKKLCKKKESPRNSIGYIAKRTNSGFTLNIERAYICVEKLFARLSSQCCIRT